MLANNLHTRSVTREAKASGNGEKVEQDVRLQMGSTNAGEWLVAVKQANSSITTDSIGTPTAGYVRYTHVATTQKRSNGQPYDFSKIINTWGESKPSDNSSLSQLFSQTLLDISTAPLPPIANLSPGAQQNILAYMRDQKIFTPSYESVKHETVDGRRVYTYTVAVQLGAYVRMMQAFAHDLDLTSLDTIDASDYSTTKPVSLTMSVDPASHQLVRVAYPSTGFSQTYTDWGLATPIQLPSHTIPVSDLQQRLQAVK